MSPEEIEQTKLDSQLRNSLAEEEMEEIFIPQTSSGNPFDLAFGVPSEQTPSPVNDTGVNPFEEAFGGTPKVTPEETVKSSQGDRAYAFVPTVDDLYYPGVRGQALKERELELEQLLGDYNSVRLASGLYSALTSEESDRIKELRQELQTIQDNKEKTFNNITGKNITDFTIFKVVTNPDGRTKVIPGPNTSPLGEIVSKAVTDLARGILALPEALADLGGEKLQSKVRDLNLPELVGKVETASVPVAVIAEIMQLALPGIGAANLAAKSKKIATLMEMNPGFSKFVGILPKGTIPAALATFAVSSEDTATLTGDADMTVAEVKLRTMAETIAFGAGLSLVVKAPVEAVKRLPTVQLAWEKVTRVVTAMFSSANPTAAENRVLETLGASFLSGNSKMLKATTPAEVDAIRTELYKELEESAKKLGLDIDKLLDLPLPKKNPWTGELLPVTTKDLRSTTPINNVDPDTVVAEIGGPTTGELLGSSPVMRIETSLKDVSPRASTASQDAGRQLTNFDTARQLRIKEQAENIRKQFAPDTQAGEKALEALEAQLGRELTAAEREQELASRAIRTQTDTALEDARLKAIRAIAKEEEGLLQAREIKDATAVSVQEVVEASPLSQTQLADLNRVINDDGSAVRISELLREDLEVKRKLFSNRDEQLSSIVISPEEAQGIVTDLINAYTSKDFLVNAESVQTAGKAVGSLIRTFISTAEDVGTTLTKKGTSITAIDKELNDLIVEIQTTGDAVRYLEIAERVKLLIQQKNKAGKGSSKNVLDDTGEDFGLGDEVELPSITALDLENIAIDTSRVASKLKSSTIQTGSRIQFKLAEGLTAYAKRLTETKNGYVNARPEVKKAVDEADVFFNDFKQVWRTETGKEWQGEIIQANTRADILGAEDKIVKLMTNPKALPEDRQFISTIISRMPEEVKTEFVASIGTRLLGEFAKSKAVAGGSGLKEAQRLLTAIDKYIAVNSNFEIAVPKAFNAIREVREDLVQVVRPAEKAIIATDIASARAKEVITSAKAEQVSAERALSTAQKESLVSINNRLQQAQRNLSTSVVAKMVNMDDPTQFIGTLFTKGNGFKQYEELWNKAGQMGQRQGIKIGDAGITPTQQNLQESLLQALINKIDPTRAKEVGDVPNSLQLLVDATLNETSTVGRMTALAFNSNPEGKQALVELQKSIARYVMKQKAGGVGAIGSTTFEKQQVQRMVDDIFMVAYGPLTKDFRQARFVNKIIFSMFGGEATISDAFVKVITDPKYSRLVIDKAADLAKSNLGVSKEEAFNISLGSTLFAAVGIKKYVDSKDPYRELVSDLNKKAKSMAIVEQTQEGLGAPPNP